MHYGKDAYVQIIVPRELIPDGAKLVEAYETDTQIIVCGDPPSEYPEGTPEEDRHNCDMMGCATLSHVTHRFNKGETRKAFELLERATAMMENEALDKTWLQEYYVLTGEHMILTEDGWTEGSSKSAYQPDEILLEVNAPK